MNNNTIFKAGILCSLASTAMGQVTDKPNIIFLMTDQQRWDAMGIFNPIIKTPCIDSLAREGIVFNQAVCQAPMSVPSRHSLMTGLYPSQNGVRTNGSRTYTDPYLPIDPLPEMLRKAGYQTAGFGKTHWGRTGGTISTRGFEVRYVGAKEVGLEEGAFYQDDDDPEGLKAYRKEVVEYGGGEESVAGYVGQTSEVDARHHRDGWVAEKCLEFIDNGIDTTRPLFLYLSFLKPHAGYNIPKPFEEWYDINEIPDMDDAPLDVTLNNHQSDVDTVRYNKWRAAFEKFTPEERKRTILRYYANCSWLDNYFGQALAKLKEKGILDNAIVIFLSDHGEMLGERHYRFTKYCLYESSVRVPLVLSGTYIDKLKKGSIDDRNVQLSDIYTTLQHVAGVEKSPVLSGINLLNPSENRTGSFCELHEAGRPAYMFRTKEWKLILYTDNSRGGQTRGEFYNLTFDPKEYKNLYDDSKYSGFREIMKTELLMHLANVWSAYPVAR
ncbi:MAG: sulfatase-like hydrolase/transferase [Mediterranea sp.]|jgi:arylsulfatase A-like enzyme|nr:sulfatase-like hydrolase/transferase [Mediterranea sp.]